MELKTAFVRIPWPSPFLRAITLSSQAGVANIICPVERKVKRPFIDWPSATEYILRPAFTSGAEGERTSISTSALTIAAGSLN